MSLPVWSGLSSQEQQWLQEAANKSSSFQRDLWRKETEVAYQKAKDEGVEIYEVDTAAFAAKVQPMLDGIENETIQALRDQIGQVK